MTEAQDIMQEEEEQMMDVTSLPGVGAATAEKLQNAGFHDMLAIAVASPGKLVDATGVSEAVARKIINAARDSMKMGFETGMDVLTKRQKVIKISVGSSQIDALLGGGFETGAITECFGEFGSGKTQIGHVLAAQVLASDAEASVVFIDTENTFRPERIKQLVEPL